MHMEFRKMVMMTLMQDSKRDTDVCIEQSFRLCGRRRGWNDLRELTLKHILSYVKQTTSPGSIPSNHLILCCPLLLLPSTFTSLRVFSNESVLRIRWPKYWSFNFSISPSNEYSGLISFRQKHQFFGAQLSL